MNRLLSTLVVVAITAAATWSAHEFLQGSTRAYRRRSRHVHRLPLETWEGEGGNLPPHEARSAQPQLG